MQARSTHQTSLGTSEVCRSSTGRKGRDTQKLKGLVGGLVAPKIVGEGVRELVRGGPRLRCFWLTSRSEPGREHCVYVLASGRLTCDCASSHFRNSCAHRTAVQQALADEAARTRQAEASAEEELPRYGITAKGRAALERWRAEQAQQQAQAEEAAARETAPLRRSQQPFSLMK